jgi:hypothetical protein
VRRAVVVARNVVDATIYGARRQWPLRSTTTYEQRNGTWQAVRSVAEGG